MFAAKGYGGILTIDDIRARLRSDPVRAVMNHWLDVRGNRRMPKREDLDPMAMPNALSFVWLCDYEPDRTYFTYRLAGEHINNLFGFSLRGRELAEIVAPERLQAIRERYRRVVTTPAIVYNDGRVYANQGRNYEGERLILPLGMGPDAVGGLLGVTYWVWGEAGLDLPEDRAKAYGETFASV